MRLLLGPNVWLVTAAAAAMVCVCAGFQTTAMTNDRLHSVITKILAQDTVYAAVLTERIALAETDVPASLRDRFRDLDDVHPLYALFALNRYRDDHYSSKELDLSSLILSTAMTCRTFKRVAVHVALIVRLIALENDGKAGYTTRAGVLAHVLPYNMDLLSTAEKPFAELIRLYDRVADIASRKDEDDVAAKDAHRTALADELRSLNATIQSSCKVGKMKDYFGELRLLRDIARFPNPITDDDTVADDVPLPEITAMLKANENAILDFYDEMALFRNMSAPTWQNLLKSPDLPADETVFKRTSGLPAFNVVV